ncbi:MAG: MutS family DNA mismatch repair protein [Candidatus Promineifilaceae bacterium]
MPSKEEVVSRGDGRERLLRRHIERLDRCLETLDARSRRLSTWRLLSFAALFVVGAVILLMVGPIPWLIVSLVLLALFIYLVVQHRRLDATAARLRIWRRLKREQLARMSLDWEEIPAIEPLDRRAGHPYARDLDVVGDRSLQRVIDLAVTQEGSNLLREWLLAFEPNLAELHRRQVIVRELIGVPDLVLRLSLDALVASGDQGQERPPRTSTAALAGWLEEQQDVAALRRILMLLLILAPLNIGLLFAYWQGWLPPLFLITWVIYGAITFSHAGAVEAAFEETAAIADGLRQLEAVFAQLNRRSFRRFPALQQLLAPIRERENAPAALLARANRLLALAGIRNNPILAILINALVPLDIFVAYRLEGLKEALSERLPRWLSVWHELEALGSLTNLAYLYPGTTFPEIIDEPGGAGPIFAANQLGHPLIPRQARVTNDFALQDLGDVALITGSNMAGKSTFLRTIGLNICLAQSGAPVLARKMRTIPFRLFASITVTDSLTDGFSFFYAEVRRLRELLDYLEQLEGTPLFFLIDEIFRGTNNRERLIGSRAYVQALAGGHGCGAIATHDLELVQLAEREKGVRNYHFRDDVDQGRMIFDYKLRPGPCPTTNALRIMRLAGLPVDSAGEEKQETKTS